MKKYQGIIVLTITAFICSILLTLVRMFIYG